MRLLSLAIAIFALAAVAFVTLDMSPRASLFTDDMQVASEMPAR